MLIFGLSISRYSRFIITIPKYFLALAVFVLAVFGVYNVQASFDDVVVMAVLGIGMFFISKYGFSAASLVLGIILGPLAEDNFLQGKIIASAADGLFDYFFLSTMNIVLISLCVFSVFYSVFIELRARKKQKTRSFKRALSMESVLYLVFALALLFYGLSYETQAAFLFPNLIAGLLIVFAIIGIFQKKLEGEEPLNFDIKRLSFILAGVLIYIFTVEIIGLFSTSLLFFVILGIIYIPKDDITLFRAVSKVLIVGVIFICALYVVFVVLLKTSVPDALLF